MTFKDPWVFILIPFVSALLFLVLKRQRDPSFRFPSSDLLKGAGGSWKIRLRGISLILRIGTIIFLFIALAGPHSVLEETIHRTEGIDMVLAIDASGSMAAQDFKIDDKRYNRLFVVKNIVKEFIAQRTSDNIGLVAFAGLAYTACPLTTDYNWLIANLERIELGLIKDGTAIGSGISSSISRLKDSKAKSKVVILLTDGVNNAGKTDPVMAARAAEALGIKIYTVGAGTEGMAPFPGKDMLGRDRYKMIQVDIDEEVLKEIAHITGGQYFRANDTETLRKIYKEIDTLEKVEIENIGFKEYKQLFGYFVIGAIFFLMMEIILSNTVFLKVP